MQTTTTTAGRHKSYVVTTASTDDAGKLVLRTALSILLLFHGFSKLIGGVGVTAGLNK